MALKIVKLSSVAPTREQLVFSGQRAFAAGDLEKAAQHLLQALELYQDDPPLLVQMGVVLYQLEKYDKAVVALKRALELDPYQTDGLNALGVVLFRLEWYAAAEIFFRRVLELEPEHASARQSLVAAMRQVRDTGDTVLGELEYLTRLARPDEPRLSLCMIVKNEETFLEGCLESVQGTVDEIVVVDTGSTDRTVEIAERFGAKIFHAEWTGDFATARNASLEHATGDWILVLDADERLDPVAKGQIKRLLQNREAVGYSLLIENRLGEEGSQALQMASVFRMFRNQPSIRFEGRIHEQVILAAQRTGLKTLGCTLKILHLGYTQNWMEDRDKLNRNLAILQTQLSEEPTNPYVHYNLGQTFKMMDRHEESQHHYERSLSMLQEQGAKPDIPYYANLYFALADLYRITRQFEAAHALLDQGMVIYPTFPELTYTKAYTFLDQEDYEAAIALYERCLTMHGGVHAGGTDPSLTSFKSLNAIGICYAKLDNRPLAKSYLAQAVAQHPDPDADLRTNLGILMLQDGEIVHASLEFVSALEKNPRELRAWINLASIYFRLGRYGESVDAWKQALLLDANLEDARVLMAEGLMKLGVPTEALEALEAELAQRPESSLAWLNVGLARLQLGELEAAKAAWARSGETPTCLALRLLAEVLDGQELPTERPADSELIRAWGAAVSLLIAGQQIAWIQTLLDRRGELGDQVEDLDLALGQVFHQHELHELAIGSYLQAQRRRPDEPAIYVALAESCMATGKYDDARIMYARASELAPEALHPRRQLANLATLQAVAL